MEPITILSIFLIFLCFYIPLSLVRKAQKRLAEKECMICHELTRGRTKVKGSLFIEILLWCFFIVPGLIYSIWRMTSTNVICSHCGSEYLKQLDKKDLAYIKKCRKKAA